MKLNGFIGPTYQAKSNIADHSRLVNYYPEIIESGLGKNGNVVYYRPTPGLLEQFEVGSGPIRLVYPENISRADDSIIGYPVVFVVSGNTLYRCYNSGSWVTTSMGTIGTSEGSVSARSVKLTETLGSNYVTVFVDGDSSYIYRGYSYKSDETFQTFVAASLTPIANANKVLWLDSFLIMLVSNSNEFHVSEFQSVSFDPLDFATSEGNPDVIVGGETLDRNLWLFNERTVEIFGNTGNPDFPFERLSGGFIEGGCLSGDSIAKAGEKLFWLGRKEKGRGCVYITEGSRPQRISNHAVETAIKSYASPETSIGFAYEEEGHIFYQLTFDEATWVYDTSSRMWHEKASLVNGELKRHRASYHGYAYGLQLVGDYQNGKVYSLDADTLTDDGEPIHRIRTCPTIAVDGKRVFHKSFQIDMEVGEGIQTGQGSDPQIMMQFSDDGGRTWSNENWKSLGLVGNYQKKVKWDQLGSAYNRVYKTVITDPIKCSMVDAFIEVEVGRA